MLAVIAKIPVQPDKREDALAAVKALLQEVAREDGTLHYTVNIDREDPDTLVFMERYRDKAALSAHGRTPHFQTFMQQVMEFAAGPADIKVYQEVAAI